MSKTGKLTAKHSAIPPEKKEKKNIENPMNDNVLSEQPKIFMKKGENIYLFMQEKRPKYLR